MIKAKFIRLVRDSDIDNELEELSINYNIVDIKIIINYHSDENTYYDILATYLK